MRIVVPAGGIGGARFLRGLLAHLGIPGGTDTSSQALSSEGRSEGRSDDHEVTVGGNVHGVTSTGRELYADSVYYSPRSQQVEGRGHVRVVQERVIMYADSMVSDLTLGQTRFFGNVHMTLR